MRSARLNPKPVPLEYTLELSRVQTDALKLLQHEEVAKFESGNIDLYPKYIGLSSKDIDARFDAYREETELNTMLILLATIEAIIRLDYIEKRRKSGRFRTLYSTKVVRAGLDELLDAWKLELSDEKNVFGKYKDALHFRNWLAHGRYFSRFVGIHEYSIEYIYDIGVQIRNIAT